jgi:hypothetical protein
MFLFAKYKDKDQMRCSTRREEETDKRRIDIDFWLEIEREDYN